MDLIAILTRYPLAVLALAVLLYLVLHFTVIRAFLGPRDR